MGRPLHLQLRLCRLARDGNDAGSYLIAGPSWKGATPPGIQQVFRSETDIVLTLTRTALDGPSDVDAVKAVQAGMKLAPLSSFRKTAPPPAAAPVSFPPYDAAKARSHDFIGYLNFLLQSMTLYTLPDRFLYANPLKRYSIGDTAPSAESTGRARRR